MPGGLRGGDPWTGGKSRALIFPRHTWKTTWKTILIEGEAVFSNGPVEVPAGHLPLHRLLGVPIMHENTVAGLVLAANRNGEYTGQDTETLRSAAGFIAPLVHARAAREQAQSHIRPAANESDARFRDLAENVSESIVRLNTSLEHIDCDPEAERLEGIPLFDALDGGRCPVSLSRGVIDYWAEHLKAALGTKKTQITDFELRHGSRVHHLRTLIVPEMTASNAVKSLLCITLDITHVRHMERELRDHRDRLEELVVKRTSSLSTLLAQLRHEILIRKDAEKSLAEQSRFPAENPNPVLRVTPEGRIHYANPASSGLLDAWGTRVGDKLPEYLTALVRNVHDGVNRREIEAVSRNHVYLFTVIASPGYDAVNFYGTDILLR